MGKTKKRLISCFMVIVFIATFTLQPLSEINVKAASFNVKYIKTMKIFSKNGGKESDAKDWCDSQKENKDSDTDNDWHVISGNLNDGAEGTLKKAVGVFIVYQTTTDPDEAITDLAVMNEKGNYSLTQYEHILNEQREVYIDIVNDMKVMLNEYRINYANERQSAITVHDFLNTYIEDDSKTPLGDLLLTISDEDLVELLLQANGQVLLTIQNQLAYACDTKDNTWLDRLSKLGSYDTMVKSLAKTKKISIANAKKAIKNTYHQKAVSLLQSWEDVNIHITFIKEYEEKNNKSEMTEDEWNDFLKVKQEEMDSEEESNSSDNFDGDFYNYIHEVTFLDTLNNYIFDDKTLLGYFAQSFDEVSGENITNLYPLAAVLTDGQLGAINESVSLYNLIESAVFDTNYNDLDKGLAKQVEEYTDEETEEELENSLEETNEMIESLKDNEPISVYDGVDRELYSGGVAITSAAETYSNSADNNWTDSFVESGAFTKTAVGLAAGATCFSIAAITCARSLNSVFRSALVEVQEQAMDIAMRKTFEQLQDKYRWVFPKFETAEYYTLLDSVKNSSYDLFRNSETIINETIASNATKQQWLKNYNGSVALLKEKSKNLAQTEAQKLARGTTQYRVIRGLKIGFTVIAILLAAADIVMSVITLYEYYNRSHVDIPKFMVDISYDNNKETSFINYKNVPSTDGSEGDLNGGGGKQWLALYSTKDPEAGHPILAPDGDNSDFIYQIGTGKIPVNYSPVHMFGSNGSAQNLTFADGEDGYSYNDSKGGIYLFFKRATNTYGENSSYTSVASIYSKGIIAIIGGVGIVVGFIIGAIVFRRPRKKKV
ncbi:MAG: hypothetical protein K6F77_07890 [Lachnospiraceae bacterium]|nr:hypothetical protein [Lachnospiraceae bacterium]